MSSLCPVHFPHGRKHLLIKVEILPCQGYPAPKGSSAVDTHRLSMCLITRCKSFHFHLRAGMAKKKLKSFSDYAFNISVMGRPPSSLPAWATGQQAAVSIHLCDALWDAVRGWGCWLCMRLLLQLTSSAACPFSHCATQNSVLRLVCLVSSSHFSHLLYPPLTLPCPPESLAIGLEPWQCFLSINLWG